MKDNPVFFTASMAGLCADQGYFDQSLKIYRHLLGSDPENQALQKAMAGIEARQSAVKTVSAKAGERLDGLETIIQRWVGLLVEHNLKSKFDKIRKNIGKLQRLDSKT
ncbi:MAG: hypothetical protein AB1724_02265 [Thermodesulfobacteriota bacterium]